MAQDRPNILLVVFDSLSAHDLSQHLGALPALRAFAGRSLNFASAYVSCPESSPARASLFTGLDMAVHGLWTDGVALPKREMPLPEMFAHHGYQSWLVGRRHLAGVSNGTTEHARTREYHAFDWAHGPLHRSRQNAYLLWLQDVTPEDYAQIFPRQADPDETEIPEDQRQTMANLPDDLSFNAWVGQRVRQQIGAAPFFGVVGFVVGQAMGGSPARLESLMTQSLQQADAAFGAILEALPETTMVVVTAGRGSVADPTVLDPLQEAAIKVPLMIRAPDATVGLVPEVVSTMDIAPTLYEYAHILPPQRIQGKSLISTAPRGWALSRMRHPDLAHQTALISGGRKLIMTHDQTEATRLYDLAADPFETQNLASAPDHQDDLEDMLDLMIDARVALEDRTEPRTAKF